MTTPKLTRSIPNRWAIGRKMGIVIMNIAFPSRKQPRINMIIMIIAKMPEDVALMFVKEEISWSGIF